MEPKEKTSKLLLEELCQIFSITHTYILRYMYVILMRQRGSHKIEFFCCSYSVPVEGPKIGRGRGAKNRRDFEEKGYSSGKV